MTIRKKIALLAVPGLLVAAAFTFAFVNAPANTLTFDVNPSIELVTNRLDEVIEINPLNDDAEALLEDYSQSDKDLEDVVNDLVDRMILTGYISGGQDNLVMITVQDNQANEALVDRVNKMIAAFLENKQIEATIVNKRLDVARDELNKDGISSGKLAVIETLLADDDRLSREELSQMKVSELVAVAKALDLRPSTLFDAVLDDDDFDDDDFDLDDDFNLDDNSDLNDDFNDDKDSDLEDDRDDDSDDDSNLDDDWKDDDRDDDRNSDSSSSDSVSSASASVNVTVSENVISADRARTIALNRVSGDIIKLSLDADDDDRPEYDVEILSGNLKYEIEIDAVTGQILKVESESVLNDDDRNEPNDDDDAVLDDSDDRDEDDDHDDDDADDDHINDDDNDDDDNDDSERDDD